MNIGYHFELIRDSMRALAEESGRPVFSDQAIEVALLSNSYTDIFQNTNVELIIDDTFCRIAKPVVECCHYDNLYHRDLIRQYTQKLLLNSFEVVKKSVESQSPLHCLLAIGMSLHIVNDFYAHSNWTELEMHRYLNKKDATYYDYLFEDNDEVLDQAIYDNTQNHMLRYESEDTSNRYYQLYTHGNSSGKVPTSIHDRLKKDFAGLPHYEWAHRAAYKASIQHLLMIREHIKSLAGGSAFWESLSSFSLSSDQADELETAVSFDEGTVRWFTIYGGAWKHGDRWSDSDIIVDNLPNATGIGMLDQISLPILGTDWLAVAVEMADGMFEAYNHNVAEGGIRAFSKQKYFETLNNFFDSPDKLIVEGAFEAVDTFVIIGEMLTNLIISWINKGIEINSRGVITDAVDEVEWYDPDDSPLIQALSAGSYETWHLTERPSYNDHSKILSALTALDGPLSWKYENSLRWLRIQVPFADDLDTGGAWYDLNWNNEEVGGTSDYWVKFIIDGIPYTEAEYVDKSHPVTNWQVLFPCFSIREIPVVIKMYESDPTDHTDHVMNIYSGDTRSLEFTINSSTGDVTVNEDTEIIEWPTGYYIRSHGGGDYRASVRVIAGRMSDRRVEIVTNVVDDNNDSKKVRALGDSLAVTGGYGWRLRRPDQQKYYVDHFTFDPGRRFKPEHLSSFRLTFADVEGVVLRYAAARCEDVKHSCGFRKNEAINQIEKPGKTIQISNAADIWITADQSEEFLQTLSAVTLTNEHAAAGIEVPVYLSFYTSDDPDAAPAGHYQLTHFDCEPFQPGHADFFWMGKQKLGDFEAIDGYGGKLKNIKRIRISKESGDDLKLDQIEFYANGHLIGQNKQPVHLTDSNPTWEINIVFPKDIRWVELPQVKCLGIKDLPAGYEDKKGIAYSVMGKLELIGYSSAPFVEVISTPSSGPLALTNKSMSNKEVLISSTIYINRHLNNSFSHKWTINVGSEPGQDPLTETASFEIPRPFVEIHEQGFWGGDQLVEENGKPALRFTGAYDYDFHNFGTENPEQISMQFRVSPRNPNHKELRELSFTLPSNSQESWPFRTEHSMQLQAKDIFDVSLEERFYKIEIPKLGVVPIVRHKNKICSYFATSNRIVKVNAHDPNYQYYVGNFPEIRSEYEYLEITLIPCLKRDGRVFSYTVHSPEFSWKVPKLLRCYSLPNGEEEQNGTLNRLHMIHRIMSEGEVIRPQVIQDLSLKLNEPRILINLAHVPKAGGEDVSCLVRDAINQRFEFKIKVLGYQGMDPFELGRAQMMKMYALLIKRYSEYFDIMHLVKNGFMRDLTFPPLDIDPVEWETLSSLEKEFVKEVYEASRIYNHYGVERIARSKGLQQRLDGIMVSLDRKVPEIESIATQRNSLRVLENNVASLSTALRVNSLTNVEMVQLRDNLAILMKIIDEQHLGGG